MGNISQRIKCAGRNTGSALQFQLMFLQNIQYTGSINASQSAAFQHDRTVNHHRHLFPAGTARLYCQIIVCIIAVVNCIGIDYNRFQ